MYLLRVFNQNTYVFLENFLKSDIYSNDYSEYQLKAAHENQQFSNALPKQLLREELTYSVTKATSFRKTGFP